MSQVKQTTRKRIPNGGRGRKRVPGLTRLSAKNQITIPIDVVRKAKLAPGDELLVNVDDAGRIVVEGAKTRSVIDEVAGCLTGVFEPNYMEDLREGDRQREIALGLIDDDDG